MRAGIVLSVILWGLILSLTGCSGLELGGKLGVYAVDTRAERSETFRRPPLKCMFVSCPEVAEKEVEGS